MKISKEEEEILENGGFVFSEDENLEKEIP